MIPESSGATPFGIFLLADEYLDAARLLPARRGSTQGPARLLAYHACELFFKAYLRSHGCLIGELRALNHDLSAMLEAAIGKGLRPKKGMLESFRALKDSNDYVRVRYSLDTEQVRDRADRAVRLAGAVRECVRNALQFDEFGNPTGVLWAGPLPSDYPRPISRDD